MSPAKGRREPEHHAMHMTYRVARVALPKRLSPSRFRNVDGPQGAVGGGDLKSGHGMGRHRGRVASDDSIDSGGGGRHRRV